MYGDNAFKMPNLLRLAEMRLSRHLHFQRIGRLEANTASE